MAYPKRRVHQHILETRSIEIVRRVFPQHWVVREYRPDYGIDLVIELFEYLDETKTQAATLGETLFVQVKATEKIESRQLRVYPRHNVEKGPLREDRSKGEVIDVAALQLECSELLTVQAMGAAVSVLLLLVEVPTERIYFLCLNDYIDKVLLPADPGYGARESKVVHLPLRNAIEPTNAAAITILELYAKRPKLYAAFQKFAYQHHELELARDYHRDAPSDALRFEAARDFIDLARHFTAVDLRLDFWGRIPAWPAVQASWSELENLRGWVEVPYDEWEPGSPNRFLLTQPMHRRDPDYFGRAEPEVAEEHLLDEVVLIWHRLRNLAAIFEENVREAFLPTYMARLVVAPELQPVARTGT